MQILNTIDINIFSIIILMILVNYINHEGKNNGDLIYFKYVIYSNIIILALTALSWIINGHSVWTNYVVNWFLIVCNTLPVIAWFVYLDYKIHRDRHKLNKRLKIYLIPFMIYIIFGVIQFFSPILFSIENSYYVRGYGFYMSATINYGAMIIFLLYIQKYKHHMDGRLVNVIALFGATMMAVAVVQLLFYGTNIFWPSLTVVTVYTFIHIERKELLRDVLTGLVTRGQFEQHLSYKLKLKTPFSIIMMDLDGFKEINDEYGHDEGDEALKVFSNNIQRVVKTMDTVCRYGGDEFIILIESEDIMTGEIVLNRIKDSIIEFNNKQLKKYDIKFSSGLLYLDHKQTLLEVLTEVDKRMYQDKNERRK